MQVSQNEQSEIDDIDVLAKEIESWKDFRGREENALLFNEMLSEWGQIKDYIRAVISKGENYSAESLFMLLLLQQQKMINQLIAISIATIVIIRNVW